MKKFLYGLTTLVLISQTLGSFITFADTPTEDTVSIVVDNTESILEENLETILKESPATEETGTDDLAKELDNSEKIPEKPPIETENTQEFTEESAKEPNETNQFPVAVPEETKEEETINVIPAVPKETQEVEISNVVPEEIVNIAEISFTQDITTFALVSDIAWEWITTGSTQERCVVLGRIEDIPTRTITINWGDNTTKYNIFTGVDVYISTGTQTYNKICHTYSNPKTYDVKISTPSAISYLDLTNQKVTDFLAGDATNLQYLSLDDNDIDALHASMFAGLTKLTELYLSNNAFTVIPSTIFQSLTNLQVLELSFNNIMSISSVLFPSNLLALDISDNTLSFGTSSSALQGLSKLQLLSLAGNNLISLPSDLLTSKTPNLTDLYIYENPLVLLPAVTGLTKLQVVSLSGNALDIAGYNDFLSALNGVSLPTNGASYANPAQYGGCSVNAAQGITAHDTLSSKPRTLVDNGLTTCVITGTVSYDPSGNVWTNSGVVATLTLDTTGTITSAGWSPNGEGLVFTKTYTGNTTEAVNFQSPSGANGTASVVISNIIASGSLGATVSYSPVQVSSGNIIATVTLSNTGGTAPNNWTPTGTGTYTRTYTGSVSQSEVIFADIAGNTIEVQINLTIDRDAPDAVITYNPSTATNSGVLATLTVNEPIFQPAGWQGPVTGTIFTKTYTGNVTENVTIRDLVGNITAKEVKISWIDTGTLLGSVSYSKATPTSGDVVATVSFNKTGVIITSTGGSSHLFTGDGTRTFTFTDTAGNTGDAVATVTGIDKIAPTATSLTYDPDVSTNGNVVATLVTSEAVVTPVGWTPTNMTTFTKTFTNNTNETIFFYDMVGNQGYTGVNITRIDTNAPSAIVSYSPSTATSGDVVVTMQVDKTVTTPTGWTTTGTNAYTKTYTGNTTESITLSDAASNTGNVAINIQRIDKEAPLSTNVIYNPDAFTPTNGNVTVTLEVNEPIITPIGWTKRSDTSYTKIFTENTGFILSFIDLVGNVGSTGIMINNIDTTALTGTIIYDVNIATSGNVVASISLNKTGSTIINNSGNADYLFTDNGDFTFTFEDSAGNVGSETAIVYWIDKTPPTATLSYAPGNVTTEQVTVTLTASEPIVVPNGWTGFAVTGLVFTKVYLSPSSETVNFYDLVGNPGTIQVTITLPVYGGGGGGGGGAIRDYCPNGDYSESFYDGKCGVSPQEKEQIKEEVLEELGFTGTNKHSSAEDSVSPDKWNTLKEDERFDITDGQEIYERAKIYDFTNKSTYEDFRPNDSITRAEIAKLISIYAVEFLDKHPDITKETCAAYEDLHTVDPELQGYIVQACQLGLMGYDFDGTTIKDKFLPNDIITRAEVATTISRMLRGNANKGSEEWWYQNHLIALKREDIIRVDIDPMTLETRENVLLMLSRI